MYIHNKEVGLKMAKNIGKTFVFFTVLFLFVIINTHIVLAEPLEQFDEYIVMDNSDSFDLLRLADLDEELVTYGFHSNEDYTITVLFEETIIYQLDYKSNTPVVLDIEADDMTVIQFIIDSESSSEIIEALHISDFENYKVRLFYNSEAIQSLDESLIKKETIFLDLLDSGVQAQLIALSITVLLYIMFMLPIRKLLDKIKLPKVKKWINRILLHILATFILYGLIIFILVTFFGEDSEYDYDVTSVYESTETDYELDVLISLVKVNGISKDALEVVYQFNLEESGSKQLVGQLYCNDLYISRIYGYKNQNELEHIYTDIFPIDYCKQGDILSLDIVDNQTGLMVDQVENIPLYIDVSEVETTFNLEWSNLGTYFSIGVILFCGLVLVPIAEILIIRNDRKK